MADEYILKSYDGGAETTTLTTPFTIGGTTLGVANGSTFPDGSAGPFVVVVDRGLATEEKFLIDTTTGVNGTTFNIQQVAYDGTSASAHSVGAVVEHCLDAYSIEQANRYVNLQTTRGDLVSRTTTTTGRLAAGTNNYVLMADSTQSLGLKYAQIVESSIADGQVSASKLASASVTAAKINTAVAGTTGQVLTVNTSAASGLEWQSASMPTGTIVQYAGTTAPNGWLLCDGTAYSQAGTYAALYAVIGTNYNTVASQASPGAGNFRVPNFKGRIPFGLDAGDTAFNARTVSGGRKDTALVSHTHTTPDHAHSLNNHDHTVAEYSVEVNGGGSGATALAAVQGPSTNAAITGTKGNPDPLNTNSSGSGTSGPASNANTAAVDETNRLIANLPPYLVVNYIIKT